jgi:hypothetical protein
VPSFSKRRVQRIQIARQTIVIREHDVESPRLSALERKHDSKHKSEHNSPRRLTEDSTMLCDVHAYARLLDGCALT